MDTDYTCTLSEVDMQRGKEELNEDPKNRLTAVATLKEWIEAQPHIDFPTGILYSWCMLL